MREIKIALCREQMKRWEEKNQVVLGEKERTNVLRELWCSFTAVGGDLSTSCKAFGKPCTLHQYVRHLLLQKL